MRPVRFPDGLFWLLEPCDLCSADDEVTSEPIQEALERKMVWSRVGKEWL
jgi:hypothetical protein